MPGSSGSLGKRSVRKTSSVQRYSVPDGSNGFSHSITFCPLVEVTVRKRTSSSPGITTAVVHESELFVESGSGSTVAGMLAVFVSGPSAIGRTLRVTVTPPPEGMPSRPQVRMRVGTSKVQPPWEGVAESNAVGGGRGSRRTTPVAAEGPLFVTVSV